MLILTGVNGSTAQVYDSSDDTNEVTNLATLVKKMKGTRKIRVYGLKLYKDDAFYPPEARVIHELGVVIVPGEAKAAMGKVQAQKQESERLGKKRKGVVTVTLKNLHKCYYDSKHSLYMNGELIDGWSEEDVRRIIAAGGNHITMQ